MGETDILVTSQFKQIFGRKPLAAHPSLTHEKTLNFPQNSYLIFSPTMSEDDKVRAVSQKIEGRESGKLVLLFLVGEKCGKLD